MHAFIRRGSGESTSQSYSRRSESREATINKHRARHSTTIYVVAIESEKSRESSLNPRAPADDGLIN